MSLKTPWLIALAFANILLTAAVPALADCKTAATNELATFARQHVTVVSSTLKQQSETVILQQPMACPEGTKCWDVTFEAGKKPDKAPPPPEGFTALAGGWKPAGIVGGNRDCKDLFEFVYAKAGVPASPTDTQAGTGRGGAADASSSLRAQSRQMLREAQSAKEALDAFKKAPRAYMQLEAPGAGQVDITGAAAEALQILGQLVVDRASTKAYGLLQTKLMLLLQCGDPNGDASEGAAAKDAAGKGEELAAVQPETKFPATCAVLASLRIQDIAMAPEALTRALAQDILTLLQGVSTTVATADRSLADAVGVISLSLATKEGQPQAVSVQRVLAALFSYVSKFSDTNLQPAQQAVAFGVLAFGRCSVNTNGSSSDLSSCSIDAELATLGAPDAVRPAAAELAMDLIAIVGAPKTDAPRVQLAIDTLAGTACMLQRGGTTPELGCPTVESITKLSDPLAPTALSVAFADALLTKNTARFIVVATKLVDLVYEADQTGRIERRRALRLLAGLLDYTATYAASSPDETDAAKTAAHEQRTKILESLTSDMSDRNEREGDDIFSLGGALRLVGGARIGTQTSSTVFYGPLGLTLGLAFTHVPKRNNACGFHVQLDAIDLGNYLALEEGPKVKTPDVGDAVSPSLTVGAACGTSLPFVIAPTVGYTPQFQIDPQNPEKRGAVNIGMTFGIHVPLIDLN